MKNEIGNAEKVLLAALLGSQTVDPATITVTNTADIGPNRAGAGSYGTKVRGQVTSGQLGSELRSLAGVGDDLWGRAVVGVPP